MEEGDRKPFVDAMSGAIDAAKAQAATEKMLQVGGTIIGIALGALLVPFLVVYAWNGLTPEGWVEWSYLPTVAGLLAFRILRNWARA